jgi:hypothetical protein
MGVAQAADVTAQAVATWSATAKDTTSKLVVTPLGSLAFQYAEGIKGFNSQKGLFDVAIEGDATATAFKLTSSDHQHPDSAGYLWFHAERGR